MDFMVQYDTSVLVIGFSGFLFFIQLLVADFTSIKEGHVDPPQQFWTLS